MQAIAEKKRQFRIEDEWFINLTDEWFIIGDA
jgi:hypothetical protein